MREFILLLLTVMILSGCMILGKKKVEEVHKSPEEIKLEIQYNEVKDFIDTKREDPDIYWGEGIANIGDDLGNARIESKDRALKDLSEKIEVHVESEFYRVLSGISQETGKKYSETIKDEIIQRSKIYTNQVITNTKEKFFTDFPRTGTMTYFVYISKKDYEEKVQRDLTIKKAKIRTGIQNGNVEFINKNYLNAIQNWLKAKEDTDNFFGQLPLQDDLDNDGNLEEINAYLYGKMNNFFGNSSLTCMYDEIFYNAQGELTQKPVILAQYTNDFGEKHNLIKLPLKAKFIQGNGIIHGNIQTETYGQAELQINQVDPTYRISSIHVEIDKQRMPGINLFSLPPMPSTLIELKKIKTIALSITFQNEDNIVEPEDLKNTIRTILLNSGFSVLSVLISNNNVNQSDIQAINDTNSDFLLFINTRAGISSTVGGYENMFATTCSGVVSLYKLPQGNVISSENIDETQGFGVSSTGAGWDAFGRLRDTIITNTINIIGKM
jgi:hypothetical protein